MSASQKEAAPRGASGRNSKDAKIFDSAAEVLAVALSCWTVMYESLEEEEDYWWASLVQDVNVMVAR